MAAVRLTPVRRQDRVEGMEVTVEIPDDLAHRITVAGGDLARRALEALALEEFRNGHVTEAELRQMLGFETRYEVDGFLKAHQIYEEYSLADFEREREALKSLGL